MFRLAVLSALILSGAAASARDRDFAIFGGGGLSIGQVSTGGENKTASKFKAQGYFAEGGMDLPAGNKWGFYLAGELGQQNAFNSLQSETYMETGKLDYYAAKIGIYVGQLGFGGGYRKNTLNIKSVSLTTDLFTESTYKGNTPYVWGNFTVDFGDRWRAAVEGSFMDSELKDGDGNKIKYKEMTAGIRVFMIFD